MNADVNVKNCLIKEFVMKDLFGILVIVNVHMINHVMLVSIYNMKTVNAKNVNSETS